MNKPVFNLAAVILSGGQGSRMGGQDKGLIVVDGRPMIMNALELVSRFTRSFAISCNRNHSTYSQFKCVMLEDKVSDFQGPLAGIHAALSHYESQGEGLFSHLLVLPCDTPRLQEELLTKLVLAAQQNPSSICYLATSERPQFLHAIIPVQLLASLTIWLEQGERAVYKWYRQHSVVEVEVTDNAGSLRNINTQADVR